METRLHRKTIKSTREKQEKELIEYLNTHGAINEATARDNLKMARCAPRICDLRKKGYEIKTVTGSFVTYYKLIKAA